ncbi:hypothetical protein SAMN00790413_02090 [Deinococcus hopiensis KR-140]|uniref:Uncharacterized protein n=1 Tax=Deinococcus hopiensis KR-140 TaxID=695939 RepID=A0A1W1VK35_9DEIO|nr:hypothetical protein SAMN00790413_02090 [Deinococcus hopiensis KR-140]
MGLLTLLVRREKLSTHWACPNLLGVPEQLRTLFSRFWPLPLQYLNSHQAPAAAGRHPSLAPSFRVVAFQPALNESGARWPGKEVYP